ncbi:hypothetical protein [Chryseobacterium sp. YIM B08800]|uniref:hypothetical protein n=1 Tax=Chryseobacterium sp. YIM B08800 TaxID=2984136 RepID=UPI00223F380E|nr:hypothetical protein [Chryseobacterium sp. YIM B08800]
MSILKASLLALGNIKSAYSGQVSSQNKEYKRIKNEVENLRVPTTRDDRENLSKDRNNAVNSYRKAFDKADTCNG